MQRGGNMTDYDEMLEEWRIVLIMILSLVLSGLAIILAISKS